MINNINVIKIISDRGCSLYEKDITYKNYLDISRTGVITKEYEDRVLVFNGYSSMWFYKNQIIKEEKKK